MWPFLLILAIVPLFFYFAESVSEVFPELAHMFPSKSGKTVVVSQLDPEQAVRMGAGEPNKWHFSQTEDGYVAWAVSESGAYRLAVGCRKDSQASLQVTTVANTPLPRFVHINYEYGILDLDQGFTVSSDLISAVSQFKTIYLQNPATEVLARFNVEGHESNLIARQLQHECIVN